MTSFAAPRAATGGPVGDGGPSGFARLVAVVFWLVVPIACVVGIVMAITTWTSHAHRQVPGIPGTFVVQNRSCGGTICQSTGTFTSTDGSLRLAGLTGGLGWEQDTEYGVVFDPSTPEVIVPLPTRWNPSAAIVALTGGVALLGVWGWLALGARRAEPDDAPAVALA